MIPHFLELKLTLQMILIFRVITKGTSKIVTTMEGIRIMLIVLAVTSLRKLKGYIVHLMLNGKRINRAIAQSHHM